MLTENIMHDCVVKLLKSNDEEAFECLCKLLVTIGKDLDHAKAKVCTTDILQYCRDLCSTVFLVVNPNSLPIPLLQGFLVKQFVLQFHLSALTLK